MPAITEALEQALNRCHPRIRQLFWFVALWLAGVTTVAVVAYAIRSVLMP